MERLTEKIGNTNCVKGCGSNCKYGFQHCRTEDWENCKTIDDVIDKLAEYEDLEEQGLLLRLPCKVGDTVYYISEGFIEPCTVETIFISDYTDKDGNCSYIAEIHYDREDCPYVSTEIYFTDIGKTVFLTQAEAERKLKEMESELYVSTSDFI